MSATIDDLLSLLPPPHIVVRDCIRELGDTQPTGHLHNIAAEMMQALDACEDCDGDAGPREPCGDCHVRIRVATLLMTLSDPDARPVRSAPVVHLSPP